MAVPRNNSGSTADLEGARGGPNPVGVADEILGIDHDPAIAPLVGGCASMAKNDRGHSHPISATAADLEMVVYAVAGKPEDEPADPFDFLYSPLCIPFFILDLPFSLVTDVITLPNDLYHSDEIDNDEEPQQSAGETNSTPSGAPLPERLDAGDRPVR